MKLTTGLLTLAAAGALLGTTFTTASAATNSTTIQALPNQSETQAAHDAVQNDSNAGNTYTTTNPQASTTSAATAVVSGGDKPTSARATAVVNLAKKLANMNIPYVWGGESLSGMDCSGLTDYVYAHAANIQLGHYTVTQEGQVTKKAVSQAKPGDLLFWGSEGASYHVAIYIGNNQFVAAPQPGQNVDVETINSYFMPSFAGTVK